MVELKFVITSRFEAEVLVALLIDAQKTRELRGSEVELLSNLQDFVELKLSQI